MALSISRGAFVTFLLKAKRRTYATQGDEATVTPFLPGSRQLEYQEGALLYRDIYFGGAFFVGQETVYEASAPVWAMCYAGGVITADASPSEVYAFLRDALRQVTAERPYRGPSQWREGALVYTDDSQGDLAWFWGIETITHRGQSVFNYDTAVGYCSRGHRCQASELPRRAVERPARKHPARANQGMQPTRHKPRG